MFEERVAVVLAAVEPGEVVTYGAVAEAAGFPGAGRAVGNFLLHHGADFPWWRVVTASGRLVPGNEKDQIRLLASEGVRVHDGRVAPGSVPTRRRGGAAS